MLRDLLDKDNRINWAIVEQMPEFIKLTTCGYHSQWHREGDALTHTKSVCEHMYMKAKDNDNVVVLMLSALFHDIGKGETGELKGDSWSFPDHPIVGEAIFKELYGKTEDKDLVEQVSFFIRNHMKPLMVSKKVKPLSYMRKVVEDGKKYPNVCNWDNLLLLKTCDCLGAEQERFNGDNWIEALDEVRKLTEKL
jgi:putative nucleotidyltransferase with HDIG domain